MSTAANTAGSRGTEEGQEMLGHPREPCQHGRERKQACRGLEGELGGWQYWFKGERDVS